MKGKAPCIPNIGTRTMFKGSLNPPCDCTPGKRPWCHWVGGSMDPSGSEERIYGTSENRTPVVLLLV